MRLQVVVLSAIRDELHRRNLGLLEASGLEAELVDLAVARVEAGRSTVRQAARWAVDATLALTEAAAS